MAVVQKPQEQRLILWNISWETYERLLADHADSSAPHFTYDRGTLEIMCPLPEHEESNRTVALFVQITAEESGLEFRDLGSTTFRREDLERGFEPDSCFYIQREAAVRGKRDLDLRVDPPPDLVIEIDITHPSLNKFPIYAALGVPEVWRYDGDRLEIRLLTSGEYVSSAESVALPRVKADEITRLLRESTRTGRLAWIRRVRDWARTLQKRL